MNINQMFYIFYVVEVKFRSTFQSFLETRTSSKILPQPKFDYRTSLFHSPLPPHTHTHRSNGTTVSPLTFWRRWTHRCATCYWLLKILHHPVDNNSNVSLRQCCYSRCCHPDWHDYSRVCTTDSHLRFRNCITDQHLCPCVCTLCYCLGRHILALKIVNCTPAGFLQTCSANASSLGTAPRHTCTHQLKLQPWMLIWFNAVC